MIGRYFDGVVPYPASSGSVAQSHSFSVEIPRTIASFATSFDALDFSRALETAWALVAAVDGYLTANAPWKQLEGTSDEQQQALRADILYTAAEAIRIITALVYPVIPDAAARVWTQLGLGDIRTADLTNLRWRGLQPGTKLGDLSPVFPRADKETITRMSDLEQKNTPPVTAAGEPANPQPPAPRPAEPHISKLHSLVDGLAVAIAESTTETAAVVGLENAIAETVRETIGSRKEKSALPRPPIAPATATPPGPKETSPEEAAKLPGSPALPPAPATGTIAAPAPHPALAGDKIGAPGEPSSPGQKITIDDFSKIELRVAQIKVAERVPKADKLLRLEVDLGTETRQILAGIAEAYAPESLIGRKVVIVANLAPRKLRGLESNGMIVAASLEGGRPVLAGFLEDVEIGARLK